MSIRLDHLVAIAALANALLLAGLALPVLRFPYAVDYGEGPLVDHARRLEQGEPLYDAKLDEPPYLINNYPPLQPALVAGLSRATGLSRLHVGRWISLFSGLAAAALVGLLGSFLTGSRPVGWAAFAFFAGSPVVGYWAALSRVDLPALALSLAGLWVILAGSGSTGRLAAAVLLFSCAILTRQTAALAAPLAAVVALWHEGHGRWLRFGLVLVGTVAVSVATLEWRSEGGFLLNVVVANVNPYSMGHALRLSRDFLLLWPAAMLGAFTLARDVLRPGSSGSGDVGSRRRHALLAYTAGAAVSAATVGKMGSNLNYLLELNAALSLWAAGSFVWLPQKRRLVAGAAIPLLLLHTAYSAWIAIPALRMSPERRLAERTRYDATYRAIEEAGKVGPVLADEHLDMVVASGGRIFLQPFEYARLHEAGRWDPSPVVRDVEARRFPLIVLTGPGRPLFRERWPEPIAAAIARSYAVTERLGETVLLRPRSAGEE